MSRERGFNERLVPPTTTQATAAGVGRRRLGSRDKRENAGARESGVEILALGRTQVRAVCEIVSVW